VHTNNGELPAECLSARNRPPPLHDGTLVHPPESSQISQPPWAATVHRTCHGTDVFAYPEYPNYTQAPVYVGTISERAAVGQPAMWWITLSQAVGQRCSTGFRRISKADPSEHFQKK